MKILFLDRPDPPINLRIDQQHNMTEGLYLAWNQPAYFGGDVYVYYELSVNGDDLEDKFVVSSQLNTTSFKVDES